MFVSFSQMLGAAVVYFVILVQFENSVTKLSFNVVDSGFLRNATND